MEFNKIEYEQGYTTIKLETPTSALDIMYGGNGDLYWNILSKVKDDSERHFFTITKENYEVFLIFSNLFRRIDECEIYTVDPLEEELCFSAEERKELYERTRNLNEDLSTKPVYECLCSNTSDTITWHSDDAPYGEGNILRISRSRDKERFLIEIIKRDLNKDDISVEISNSGSRYQPFNIHFMEHYNDLNAIDPNYHQIHIEEILYHKRLTKTRKESK